MSAVHKRLLLELSREYLLSQREEEIFVLLGQGRSGPYIARELGISDNTVKSHVRHIYSKLKINSKQELLDLVLPS